MNSNVSTKLMMSINGISTNKAPIDIAISRKTNQHTITTSMYDFVRTFIIHVPESQRSTVWDIKSKSEFVTGLLHENSKNELVVNDIKSSLRHSTDDKSTRYYTSLSNQRQDVTLYDGTILTNVAFTHEICDGNNRRSTIIEFLEGKVPFTSNARPLEINGAIFEVAGLTLNDIRNDKVFGKLATEYIENDIMFSVKVLTEMSLGDVCDYMIALNKAVAWKPQNFRMVFPTDVTEFIRGVMADKEIMKYTNYDVVTRKGTRSHYKLDHDISLTLTSLLYCIATNTIHNDLTAENKEFDRFHRECNISHDVSIKERLYQVLTTINQYSKDVNLTDAIIMDLYITIESLRAIGHKIECYDTFSKYFLSRNTWRRNKTAYTIGNNGSASTVYKELMRNAKIADVLRTRYTIISKDVKTDVNTMYIGTAKTDEVIGHNSANIRQLSKKESSDYSSKGFVFTPSTIPKSTNSEYNHPQETKVI